MLLLNGLKKWYASQAKIRFLLCCFLLHLQNSRSYNYGMTVMFVMSETDVSVLGVTIDDELYFCSTSALAVINL